VWRTEEIWVKESITLKQLAHQVKNLYNQANYIIKYQLRHSFTGSYGTTDDKVSMFSVERVF